MAGDLGILEFDLEQKWAKGLRIHFCDSAESLHFKDSEDFQKSYSLKQVHSKKLVNWSTNASPEKYREIEADGFIARGDSYKNSRKKLIIRTADCCPLFYVDRETQSVAAIHAGWRGLAQGIHLLPFKEGFDPKSTWIWCGPCLDGDSFEVSEDMWSQFSKDIQNNSNIFSLKKSTGDAATAGKRFFNCWNYLSLEFKKLDVSLFYNVEVNTFTDKNFNSYRRWKKEGNESPTPHNYSWISFV